MPMSRWCGGTSVTERSSNRMSPASGGTESPQSGSASWSCLNRSARAAKQTSRPAHRAKCRRPPPARQSACSDSAAGFSRRAGSWGPKRQSSRFSDEFLASSRCIKRFTGRPCLSRSGTVSMRDCLNAVTLEGVVNYQDITYAVDDRVAVITLNRPDRMNAFGQQLRKGVSGCSGARRSRIPRFASSS